MNLWKSYKSVLHSTFPEMRRVLRWGYWKSEDTTLVADLYHHPYFIKSTSFLVNSCKHLKFTTF